MVRTDDPNALKNKLVALEGDMMKPGLGLSPTDTKVIIENVTVIFNLAATIRFDEDLRTAFQMNVKGPRQLLNICHQMKHLNVGQQINTFVVKLIYDLFIFSHSFMFQRRTQIFINKLSMKLFTQLQRTQ